MAKFDDKVNGNTVNADEYNNMVRASKNLIEDSGQTIDSSNTQQSEAVANYVGSANFYTDSGVANAYVLSTTGSFKAPTALVDGLEVRFRTSNPNTGASTINVAGLGNVDIKEADGVTDVGASFISSTSDNRLRYDAGNSAFIPAVSADSFNKNLIINGDFEIAQRGTSFTSVSPGYTLDRWAYGRSGTMVHDITQDTDTPTVGQAGRYIPKSILIDCTTIDASITPNAYCFTLQKIEGYNFQAIAQKTFTLSFWVKATKTGTYCVAFRNSGLDRSYVAEYTINTTNTWEKKTITVSTSPSTGTWNYTNGVGLEVLFTLASGTAFQTTAGSWQTGSFFGTSNQVNACDNTANNFRLTGVQVEAGSVATEFEKRSIQEEVALCQRYYYFNTTTYSLGRVRTSDNLSRVNITYPTELRATPSTTINTKFLGTFTDIVTFSSDKQGARFTTQGTGSVSEVASMSDIEFNAEL
jgi:hypothetical protein